MIRPGTLMALLLTFCGCEEIDTPDEPGRVTLYGSCVESWQCEDGRAGDTCMRGQCTTKCDPWTDHSTQCAPLDGFEPLCRGHCILPCEHDDECPVEMTCEPFATSPWSRCMPEL